MSNDKRHRDDFKKVFETNQFPEVPFDMEEKIMLGIEFEQLREKRNVPKWINTNLVILSASMALLALLSAFQFMTRLQTPLLQDLKLLLLSTTGIFFILWVIDSAEGIIFSKTQRRFQSNPN